MAIKLLINGISGSGKTSLLSSLTKDTFVISRDNKQFPFPIPHMLVDRYIDMQTLLYGGEITENNETIKIEGIIDKLEKYHEKFNKYPKYVVFDTVSQLTMDVIDTASVIPTAWGEQGAYINKELSTLTKFIHEDLVLNNIGVIFLNHIIEEKEEGKSTGRYISFGQGKFLAKGAFFSITDEAITILVEGSHRVVYTDDINKLARTMLKDLPKKIYVENFKDPSKSKKLKENEYYFDLADHIKKLEDNQLEVSSYKI